MKEKTRIIFNGILFSIALLALGAFFVRLILFKPHDYFYVQHPNIQKHVGVNVVSRHADFAFFTYHTLLFFAVWLILFSLSNLFAWKKLNAFIRKSEVVSFVFVNYVITCTLYTFFELTSGNITFGYYGNTPMSFFNLVTNLFNHYLLFFLSLAIFLKVKTTPEKQSNNVKRILFPLLYLLTYYIAVKITGTYCYKIVWYPYPIFDVQSLALTFGLIHAPYAIQVIVFLLTLLAVIAVYMGLYLLCIRKKHKQCDNA